MNFLSSTYSYNFDLLKNMETIDGITGLWGIVAGGILFLFLLLLAKKREAIKIAREKALKKKTLWDLVTMKEIQGEIEQEMRDALIRAELRSKKDPSQSE
jgi:hypothetical protein